MKKGGGSSDGKEIQSRKMGGQDFIQNRKKMKKNMQRLGGKGGLSLESFANAKTRNDNYNPSLIKKQREFYKNAKCVQKYKRTLKQHEHTDKRPVLEGENETNEDGNVSRNKKSMKKKARNLEELYEKKHEEEEKARIERERLIQAKKEDRQQSEARRKVLKEKMYKKTKSGQPVMRYRIEHLLESIQGQAN